uniref:PPUP8236 n=1 Tax=Poeciliopsis prolifica TaxID=188132 RepID=A0A0S7ESW8_9TELE
MSQSSYQTVTQISIQYEKHQIKKKKKLPHSKKTFHNSKQLFQNEVNLFQHFSQTCPSAPKYLQLRILRGGQVCCEHTHSEVRGDPESDRQPGVMKHIVGFPPPTVRSCPCAKL